MRLGEGGERRARLREGGERRAKECIEWERGELHMYIGLKIVYYTYVFVYPDELYINKHE